jgi:hypothetical protein
MTSRERGNRGEWRRRVQRHLDQAKAFLDQCIADGRNFVRRDAAQDCNQGQAGKGLVENRS